MGNGFISQKQIIIIITAFCSISFPTGTTNGICDQVFSLSIRASLL